MEREQAGPKNRIAPTRGKISCAASSVIGTWIPAEAFGRHDAPLPTAPGSSSRHLPSSLSPVIAQRVSYPHEAGTGSGLETRRTISAHNAIGTAEGRIQIHEK